METEPMSKAKKWALVGCIIASFSPILTFINTVIVQPSAMHRVAGLNAENQLMTSQVYQSSLAITVVFSALVGIAELVFFWLAFVNLDKKKGYGWSIFLLVMGIFAFLAIFVSVISLLLPTTQEMLAASFAYGFMFVITLPMAFGQGLCFVMAFVQKRKSRNLPTRRSPDLF